MKQYLFIFIALALLCFGLQAKPADAAITFATSTKASMGSSGTTDATTTAVNTTGATLLVAEVETRSTTTLTLTDSASNTWNGLGWVQSLHGGIFQMYYVYNPTVGASHTFHLHDSATSTWSLMTISAFSGTVTSSAVYDTGTYVTSTADPATSTWTGTSTPSQASDLFVTGWGSGHIFSTSTVSGGFTIDQALLNAANNTAVDAYFISNSMSSQKVFWTTNATSSSGIGLVSNIAAFESAMPLPGISSFSASPASVVSGVSSTLSWNVAAGTATATISISPGSFSTSTLVASTTVNPTSTTVYTLTATNANGSSTATTTVTVTPLTPPTVTATSSAVTTSTAIITPTITATGGLNATVLGVNYGTSTSYGNVASTTGSFGANATSSFNLTGLLCNTTYHYQGFATNSGGTGTSTDQILATPGCIADFPVSAATFETGAYVVWQTDSNSGITGDQGSRDPSTSQINYGTTTAYGSSTVENASLVSYHEQTITGLLPGTTYHYQVVSTDANGNTAISADGTFTTLASPTGTVKTVKSSGGNYTSVQACASAASSGWTCEVYSGGASDTSTIAVATSSVAFIAHDAVEVPGFNMASGANYTSIEGFEISTAAYPKYQTSTLTNGINISNNANNETIQSDYIHNIYDGGFISHTFSTDLTSGTHIIGNIMAFTDITNQNPPYTYPVNAACSPNCASGSKGILLGGNYILVQGNNIEEADHLIEVGGSYDVMRENIAHDTYAGDYGASSTLDHVDFFHTPGPDGIHQVIEDNYDYNRNDWDEHFLLDEGYTFPTQSQYLGTGNGVSTTFGGALSLGASETVGIAPFSVLVLVCSDTSTSTPSTCDTGGIVGSASVYDNGFGVLNGNGSGTITYSGTGVGSISATFTSAPASGHNVIAYYGLVSNTSHDLILRGNLEYNVGSNFAGGGNGGVSGVRAYNNTVVHVGYNGQSTNLSGAPFGFATSGSSVHGSPNWVAVNNIFDDAYELQSGYTPWTWSAGNAGAGAFASPPEYPPGYSLVFTPSCDLSHSCSYSSPTTNAPGMVMSTDPLFTSTSTYSFSLLSGSPARNAGTYLTTVASTDSGSGTTLVVNDAGFFQDGYGISGVDADCISVTTVGNHVCISSINYQTNTITLSSAITRSPGDPVWLYSNSLGQTEIDASAPDMGAFAFNSITTYTIGGTVTGLTGTVTLQNNGADTLSVTSSSPSFTFATPTSTGGTYNVTVSGQPAGENCTVSSGSGTVSTSNVTNVSVSCTATAPIISSIATGTPLTTSATITWTTDQLSDSLVEYGTSTTYTASSTYNSSYVTSHSVALSGLSSLTTYHFRVDSSDGALATSSDQTFTTASAGVPSASNVGVSGATTTIGQLLTGTYTFSDPNNKPEASSTYKWLRSSSSGGIFSPISGAISVTYTPTSADIGQYLRFQVTPVSQSGTGTAAISTSTNQINSSGPPTASSVSISGTQTEGDTLTGNYTYSQTDGVAEGTSLYQWLEANTSGGSYSTISGATGSTYALAPGDVGKYLKFQVTPIAEYPPTTGTAVLSSPASAIAPSSLPVASNVSVSGTLTIGNTLTGSYTYTDANNHPEASSTYRWLEATSTNGTYAAISGATSTPHTLVSSDVGNYLKFEVTPFSTVASGTPVQSVATTQIQNSGVPTASSVSISGTPTEGQTLTGSYSYSDPNNFAESSSTFHWLEATSSNGTYANIIGATAKTYTLLAGDVGRYLEFRVIPVSSVPPTTGTSTFSGATIAVSPSSYPVASSVTVVGPGPSVGQTLTGSYVYSDAGLHAESGSLYQWLSASTSGGTYAPISGATSLTYTLLASDAGNYLKFQVTPVSTVATGSSTVSAATAQVAAGTVSISSVSSGPIYSNSALVSWVTTIAADSSVSYGTTISYDSTAYTPTLTTSHAITLWSLTPATLYHFSVTSAVTGTSTTSGDNTFTTAPQVLVGVSSGGFGSSASSPRVTTPPSVSTPVAPSAGSVSPHENGTPPSSLQTQLDALTARLNSLLSQQRGQGTSSVGASSSFPRTLSYGMTGSDVRLLQEFLIQQNAGPAARALAKHGTTLNFGALTRVALIEFQKRAGIAPASGYFGPVTRAYVESHMVGR